MPIRPYLPNRTLDFGFFYGEYKKFSPLHFQTRAVAIKSLKLVDELNEQQNNEDSSVRNIHANTSIKRVGLVSFAIS
jgi:hypothetical protein